MDFGRLDTSKNYPKHIFGMNCHCSFTAYSINIVGFQSLKFKQQDRKVVWVTVNHVVWLQFYDWQCYGMEENTTNILPGDLFSAGVNYS